MDVSLELIQEFISQAGFVGVIQSMEFGVNDSTFNWITVRNPSKNSACTSISINGSDIILSSNSVRFIDEMTISLCDPTCLEQIIKYIIRIDKIPSSKIINKTFDTLS